MITPEPHAEIRRFSVGEHCKVGTIAAALGVPPDTVRAARSLLFEQDPMGDTPWRRR